MRKGSEDDELDDLEEVLISTIDEEPDLEAGRQSAPTQPEPVHKSSTPKPALSKSKSGISKRVTLPSAETFRDKVSQAVSRISGTGDKGTGQPFRSSSKDGERRASERGGASGSPTLLSPSPTTVAALVKDFGESKLRWLWPDGQVSISHCQVSQAASHRLCHHQGRRK